MQIDMRTVVLLSVANCCICTLFSVMLWRQNRHRFAGLGLLSLNFVAETGAFSSLLFRGTGIVPDWLSLVVTNILILLSAFIAYVGLERFLDKPGRQFHNILAFVFFSGLCSCSIALDPGDFHNRSLFLSLGILFFCLQSVWLLWRQADATLKPLTFTPGLVFFSYCLLSVVRIVEYFLVQHAPGDYFHAGMFDSLVLVCYMVLVVFMTYALTLMVNQRLTLDIAQQEEKFSKAFHSASYGVVLSRIQDGTILDVNEQFVSITGFSRAEVIGRRSTDLNLWDDIEDRDRLFGILASAGRIRDLEARFRTRQGRLVSGLLSAEVIRIKGESVVMSSIADITERKQMEEALRKSQHLLDQAEKIGKVGGWEVDLRTREQTWTETVYQINEVGPDFQPTVENSLSFCTPESRQSIEAAMRRAEEQGTPFDLELEIVTAKGNPRTIHAIGQADLENHKLYGFFQDITERKRAEAELRRHRERLEELVRDRTAALAEARDQAQAANRAKSVFLANMSHELRTPLTAILGFSDIMSHDLSLSGRTRESLGIILRSGEHLLSLINNILDLSKIEAGRVTIEARDSDLDEQVRDVIGMMHSRAEAKGLRLFLERDSSFPHVARIDTNKFRQILVNLLSNAIKFTDAGRVTLRLSASPLPAGHLLKIEVQDTGVGISPEDAKRIYRPFEQVGTKVVDGTGLGLAITRQYVELMGGEISVESEPGKGSCFNLTILAGSVHGFQPGHVPKPRHPAKAAGLMAQGRILIVDDQPEARLLLRRLLEHHGFQIREAENGREGLAIFQEWHPNLIFLDRRMPVLDGIETIRQLRLLPGGDKVVVVACSAHSFLDEQQEMLDAGCNDFFGKPFAADSLLPLLEKHLQVEFVDGSGQ